MEVEKFEVWALVELFGHNKIVGKCTERNVAGSNFLVVDVPETKSNPTFTRLIGGAAIYAINPITEDLARTMAEGLDVQPINAWDVKKHNELTKKLLSEGQSRQALDADMEEDEEEDHDDSNHFNGN